MSANSETMNYKLPVFLANDIPSWLTDWNGSMRKIDELIFNANSDISDLQTKDTQTENTVNGINERLTTVENDLDPSKTGIAKDVATLETTVTNHTKELTELDTVTTNLTTLCGDTTLQTTNKTLTGAVNELNDNITGLSGIIVGSDYNKELSAENATLIFNSDKTTGVKSLTFNISSAVNNKEFRVSNAAASKLVENGFSGVMGETTNGIIAIITPPKSFSSQGFVAFHVSIMQLSASGITYPSILPNGVVYK